MLTTLGHLVRSIREVSRRREVIATPVLGEFLRSVFSGQKTSSNFHSSSRKASQNRIRLLPFFTEESEFRSSAFKPSQPQPSFFVTVLSQSRVIENVERPWNIKDQLVPLQSSPYCFQRRTLSFQQTGLKRSSVSGEASNAWHLKIFAFFVLSALLSRSSSVSASENNTELSCEELKEIVEDLHIEGISDPKTLQQGVPTKMI